MRQNTITGETHYPVAETLWILAGIILLLAFGDVLILLALAVAVVAMATVWWAHRTVEHRAQRTDAEVASVTHLRPASTGHRDLKAFTAHAPWRGRSVA
jgi:ABC-type bacteriocin/lantibiotic exporter with double-glycine peptidase domain